MAKLKDSIEINVSADKLWPLLTTPTAIRAWLEGIEVRDATPDYPNVGSSLEWAYGVAGLSLIGEMTVADMQPDQSIRYKISGLITGTQNWYVSQTGSGVRVEVDSDYTLSAGVLGRVADPLVQQSNAATLKKSLANLKQQAEGEGSLGQVPLHGESDLG